MGTLFIILNQLFHQGEGMLLRHYGKKHGSGGMFFNAFVCFFAMLFFVVTDKGDLYFPAQLLIYGIADGVMFAAAFYSTYVALHLGSYAITKLVSSFSCIVPILYGVAFLQERINIVTYFSFVLVLVSMLLVNGNDEKDKHNSEKKSLSVKWLVSAVISAVSNGFIFVIMRMQQLEFEKKCDNEFMIISLFSAFVLLFAIGLVTERHRLTYVAKHGSLYSAIAGILNGAANFANLYILIYVPISIATPLKTGVGIVMSFVVSVLIYKERFTRNQLVGAVVGFVGLMLLKISQNM